MRKDLNDIFMNTAMAFAERSTCVRYKVGAVLVKDNRILCCGYNGAPSGVMHCDEIFFEAEEIYTTEEFKKVHGKFSRVNELHAEQNIISYCAKNGIAINGTQLYITLSPCNDCAKLLFSAGITEVYYRELYDREENIGLNFLKENGIKVQKF